MVDLLIPYTPLADHPDPLLEEFTYGDVKSRGKKLKKDLEQGDFIFLHTSIRGRKAITAYYVVGEVLEVSEAYSDQEIRSKYKNPHLERYREYGAQNENDVIVFGDPIRSKILKPPLPFDRELASKLSLNIQYRNDLTENQSIAFSTRQWRELKDEDVTVLLCEIKKFEEKALSSDVVLSTDEVLEIREIDLENFIVINTDLIGEEIEFIARQRPVKSGRLDLLFESPDKIIVVELKLNEIGKRAINQLRGYMRDLRKEYKKEVRGIILCKDILPTFVEEFKNLKNIQIFYYGWKLHVYPQETA